MADFTYGNEAVGNSPGTPVYEAEQKMNEKFGQSNMMLALVPLAVSYTHLDVYKRQLPESPDCRPGSRPLPPASPSHTGASLVEAP